NSVEYIDGNDVLQTGVNLVHYYGGSEYSTTLAVADSDPRYAPPFSKNLALSAVRPQFVDEANFDLHLAAGSPLRGAGVSISDSTWGTPSGFVDLGAFGMSPAAAPSQPAPLGAVTVTVTGGSFTYDGAAHAATVSVTGSGGLNLSPAPTYSGSCSAPPVTVAQGAACTASYTYAGDANHSAGSGSGAVTITSAPVKVLVGSSNMTYDGTPKAVSMTVSPSSMASATVLTYTCASPAYNSASAPSNAGTYTATAALNNANYALT